MTIKDHQALLYITNPNNTRFQGKWLEVFKNHRCNNGKTLVNYNVQTPLTKKPLASSILGNKSTLKMATPHLQLCEFFQFGTDVMHDKILWPRGMVVEWDWGLQISICDLRNGHVGPVSSWVCYKVLYSLNMLFLPSIVGGTLFRNQSTNTWQRVFYSPI